VAMLYLIFANEFLKSNVFLKNKPTFALVYPTFVESLLFCDLPKFPMIQQKNRIANFNNHFFILAIYAELIES